MRLVQNDDRLLFSLWLREPGKIAAPVPSSAALCRAMAAQVDPVRAGAVVELGGGTGAVTRALLARGIAPERLIVIELDRRLAGLLARRFRGVRVIQGDVAQLDRLLADVGVDELAAVVSGLPLRVMPDAVQRQTLEASFHRLADHGVFVQYTYRLGSPVSRKLRAELRLEVKNAESIWLNLPPARVWRYRRSAGASARP